MEKVQKWFLRCIYCTMLLMVGYIIYGSIFKVNNNAIFIKRYIAHPEAIQIAGALILGIFIWYVFKALDKLSEKNIRIVTILLFGVLFIGQIIFVCNFNITQITDSYIVEDQALALNHTENTIDASNPYFQKYGNNYFVTVVLSFIFKGLLKLNVKDLNYALSIVNMFLLLASVALLWGSVIMMRGKRSAAKFLFMCAINPMYYLLIGWNYTAVYCIPFMAAIIFLSISIYKEISNTRNTYKLIGYSVALGVISMLGYQMRPTAVILLIAFSIIAVMLVFTRKELFKYFIVGFLGVSVSILITFAGTKSLVNSYVTDDTGNFPVTHWIMMGLHGEGTFLQKDEQFTNSFKTKEEKKRANIEEIKHTLNDYGLSGLVEHTLKKLSVTWTDGYADFNVRLSQNRTDTRLYQYLVSGKTDFVVIFAQIYYIVIWCLLFLSIMWKVKEQNLNYMFGFILSIFGYIVFYLLWEGKAIYAVSFHLILILCAADGMEQSIIKSSSLKNEYKKLIRKGLSKLDVVIIVATVIGGIAQYNNFVNISNTCYDYSVRCNTYQFMHYNSNIGTDKLKLEQEFYASKKFNEFSLAVGQLENTNENNCTYNVALYDDNGKQLFQQKVSAQDIKDQKLTFKLDKCINPKGKKKFRIFITGNNNTDSIKWGYRQSKMSDNYEGFCYLNGEQKNYDLFLVVDNQYQAPYTSSGMYVCFILLILVFEFALYVLLNRYDKRVQSVLEKMEGK